MATKLEIYRNSQKFKVISRLVWIAEEILVFFLAFILDGLGYLGGIL